MIYMINRKYTLPILLVFITLIGTSLACSWSLGSKDQQKNQSPTDGLFPLLPGEEPEKPDMKATFVSPVQGKTQILSEQDDALSKLYEQVNPGIVAIWVITPQGIGQGTGFVVDNEGHIVTNQHVVEMAEQVEVNFPSGYKTYGTVIARDPDSDIGIVKVNAPSEELKPLPLGDSDKIKIGQTVVAIGNPFGLSGTMTIGIISGKGRTSASLRSTPSGDFFTSSDMIQTDAAINPGNSGGPLINLQGEVVGVNRSIQTNSFNEQGSPVNTGIGFAVATNIVKRVLPSLIASGKYDYPYIGIEGLPELTLEAQKELNLPRANGIYVTGVTQNGPAVRSDLRRGDLIIAIDRQTVNAFGEMISYLFNNKSPGDSVVLTILRGKEQLEIPIKLDRRP
jgi:S1-C subfamily serine protease